METLASRSTWSVTSVLAGLVVVLVSAAAPWDARRAIERRTTVTPVNQQSRINQAYGRIPLHFEAITVRPTTD